MNAIAPGMFDTRMIAGIPAEVRDRLIGMVLEPGRMGDPAEFAHLVEHIVANRYLNAETIRTSTYSGGRRRASREASAVVGLGRAGRG